jgi:RimJ/RimL family protein N-acetyltransferase
MDQIESHHTSDRGRDEAAGLRGVRLREVVEADLAVFCEFQLDPRANEMAGTYARSQSGFIAHWTKILRDAEVAARTILEGDSIAGNICCFRSDDRHCVGYWIGTPFWGRGIATQALRLFLQEIDTRPLYAYVAGENAGSIRVLEKNGFVAVGRRNSPESERYRACEEIVMELAE